MDSTAAGHLLELNNRFYEQFGGSFSAARERLQPGVLRILSSLGGEEQVLDLGCGNGELACELARRQHRGRYLGLDSSLSLLREAQKRTVGLPVSFLQMDLARMTPIRGQMPAAGKWSLAACFAVLHHIPGEALRLEILNAVRGWLAPEGCLALSNWQFLNSARLVARIQPWEAAGLEASRVDPGDYLLDWKRGGKGLRYVHHFSAAELEGLAGRAGFEVVDAFLSDGAGGNLGLYQIWKPRRN